MPTRHALPALVALASVSIPAVGVTGPAPKPASETSTSAATAAVDPELLRIREAAWRSWFAGDEAGLRAVLPPEFVGIDMGDGPFADLAATLEASRAFAAGGGRLVQLEFPETRAQRFGDVVVLYGRFRLVLDSGGKLQTFSGRLTEVFEQRAGRWWHPGWHLDLTSTKAETAG